MQLSKTQLSNAQASNEHKPGAIALLSMGLLCMSLLCVSLLGCAPVGGLKTDSGVQPVDAAIDTVTIAAIKQAPKVNAIVQLKGKVGNRAPLLGKTAYELQDTTGSLWVLATDAIPNAGDEVVIQGKLLYQSILLNGEEEGSVYLEQQYRRTK